MNKIKLANELIEELNTIEYPNGEQMDLLLNKTEIIMRRLYGDDSHFVIKLRELEFSPVGQYLITSYSDVFRETWDNGVYNLKLLLESMQHDIELFDSKDPSTLPFPDKVTLKWLKENTPFSLWWRFGIFVFTVFAAGFTAGKMDFLRKIYAIIFPE